MSRRLSGMVWWTSASLCKSDPRVNVMLVVLWCTTSKLWSKHHNKPHLVHCGWMVEDSDCGPHHITEGFILRPMSTDVVSIRELPSWFNLALDLILSAWSRIHCPPSHRPSSCCSLQPSSPKALKLQVLLLAHCWFTPYLLACTPNHLANPLHPESLQGIFTSTPDFRSRNRCWQWHYGSWGLGAGSFEVPVPQAIPPPVARCIAHPATYSRRGSRIDEMYAVCTISLIHKNHKVKLTVGRLLSGPA